MSASIRSKKIGKTINVIWSNGKS